MTSGQPDLSFVARRAQRELDNEAERQAHEHPLDTLIRAMESHGWDNADPMLVWARQARDIPYPMSRAQARLQGYTFED